MKGRQTCTTLRKTWWACLLMVLTVARVAQAQVGVGDNTQMSLNGFLGMGYSGGYQNFGPSAHGLFGTGNGQLSGFYYDPNFLSFDVRPFYNRNQDNGSFGSVLNDTGVEASTHLFSGTHFPGAVSFSKAFTNGSQYGIPGSAGLSSDSSTQNFSVTWNELLPKYPTLTGTFGLGSSSATLQGEPGTTDSSSRTFNLMSNYKVDGWGFMGFMNHQNFRVTLPAFLSPTNATSDSSSTSYGVSANHALPLSGMLQAGYNRTDYASETGDYHTNGATDTADTTVSLKPTEKLTVSGQLRYIGNLIGSLQQSLGAGAGPLPTDEQTSHGLSLNGFGSYMIGHGFVLTGFVNRQRQTFEGTVSASTQAGGTLTYNYSRPLFGMLYFSFGMVNSATNNGPGSLGFVGSVNFRKQFGGWQVDSNFSYTQNAQTIISYYTMSNYSYGGMVRRRFGVNSIWTGSYHGMRSGLTELPGYGNRSDAFLTTLGRGKFALSGTYSQSHGTAFLSTAGVLTPNQLAPLLNPDQAIYDGKTYGGGVSVIPIKRMIISANWYKTQSDTLTSQLFSNNNSQRIYTQMQYNLRKLSFRAGYWRTVQQIGVTSTLPTQNNTYYFNLSRWFNVF